MRFGKLNDAEQEQVRRGRATRLFHLRPDRFPGLAEENAALLTELVRVARSALDTSEQLGSLDANELRVVHQRLARYYRFDLTVLARRLLAERLPQLGSDS